MTAGVDLVVIGAYALLLLVVGGYHARRQDGAEGFYLANRTLGSAAVFGTTFATFFGTGLVFTLAGFGYQYGVGAFMLVAVAVFGFVLFALTAPRLKRASDAAGAVTLPVVMERHWEDRTVVLAAIATALLFAGTLGANLLVVGTILEVVLDVPAAIAVASFGLLVVTYTTLGGFKSVLVTDVLQTVCIVVCLLVLLPWFILGVPARGGFGSLPASHLDPFSLPGQLLVVYLLVGVFAFFGSQDLFQRVYAARSPRAARRGMLSFAAGLAVMGAGAVGLGMAARVIGSGTGSGRVLIELIDATVPAGFVGIVLLGVLGLANSDADSQVLTVASTITHDLLPRLGYDTDGTASVRVERFVVAGIGTVAVLVAVTAPGVAALLGALGAWFAVLGVVIVATLFWDRTTDAAAFAGLLVGYTLPVGFVAVTGKFGAAPVVGVIPAVFVLVSAALLDDVDVLDGLHTIRDR